MNGTIDEFNENTPNEISKWLYLYSIDYIRGLDFESMRVRIKV
jgi:hypothetical protein